MAGLTNLNVGMTWSIDEQESLHQLTCRLYRHAGINSRTWLRRMGMSRLKCLMQTGLHSFGNVPTPHTWLMSRIGRQALKQQRIVLPYCFTLMSKEISDTILFFFIILCSCAHLRISAWTPDLLSGDHRHGWWDVYSWTGSWIFSALVCNITVARTFHIRLFCCCIFVAI